MHSRRLITFLLGAWFTLVIMMAGVAMTSFQVARKAANAPPSEAQRTLSAVGEPMTDQLFRYIAAEINRTLFELSGRAELAILIVLAAALLLQNYNRWATFLAGVLLLSAVASHFLLTPQLMAQGRILDFGTVEILSEDRARFAKLHMLFGATTIFRLMCGMWLAGIMLYRGPGIWRRRRNINSVDNAQDGHVDR